MEPGTGKQEPENRGFRKLIAWQKADALASAVFQVSRRVGDRDRWLAVQLLRAAVSAPANIAEGYGRGTLADYIRFLEIANGSLNEVEYYLHFLEANRLLQKDELTEASRLQHEAAAVLTGLMKSLRTRLGEHEPWRRGFVSEPSGEYLSLRTDDA